MSEYKGLKIVTGALYAIITLALILVFAVSATEPPPADSASDLRALGFVVVITVSAVYSAIGYAIPFILAIIGLCLSVKNYCEASTKIYFGVMMILPVLTLALYFFGGMYLVNVIYP